MLSLLSSVTTIQRVFSIFTPWSTPFGHFRCPATAMWQLIREGQSCPMYRAAAIKAPFDTYAPAHRSAACLAKYEPNDRIGWVVRGICDSHRTARSN